MVYGRFDSKIRFENELDGRFDWRFDSNEKTIRRSLSIGYMGDGFYRSKDPTNSIKVLKEKAAKENNTKT